MKTPVVLIRLLTRNCIYICTYNATPVQELNECKAERLSAPPYAQRGYKANERIVGELFSKFDEIDRQIDVSPVKYANFIDQLEKKFKNKEG